MNVSATLFIVAFGLFLLAFFCTCCMGYSSMQRQRARTRPHNHMLIAVIPTSTDDPPAQNRFDGSYWGPPPPPYTPTAPNESSTDHTSTATSPSFITNRLQTASPPPQYESPPPYF